MSEIYMRNDVLPGYLNPAEVEEYVNRIRCAAKFGDTTSYDIRECRRSKVKKEKIRKEVEKICEEWRCRVNTDCSYRNLSEEYWKNDIKNRIRDNARDIIKRITNIKLDESDIGLDSELKWICVTWLEDFHTTITYCPNHVCITPKDIYDSLWKSRDFELDHLWQRSVFLTAYLVMCFTGYGAVLLQLFKIVHKSKFEILFPWLNVTELAIAFVGVILSVMWIMMGKGSKAWYEQYEQSIYNIETDPKYSELTIVDDMYHDRVMHGRLQGPPKVHDGLLNTAAGRYSVSRINIGIGQVSLWIWILLLLGHIILFLCEINYNDHTVKSICFPCVFQIWWKLLLMGGVVGFIIYMFFRGIPGWKSTTIIPTEERDKKRAKRKEWRKNLRENIWKEERKPKTLIVLGDKVKQTHQNFLHDVGISEAKDMDSIKHFYLPKDSRYISLDYSEQINGIEESNILRINGKLNVENFIERNRTFFNSLSETNMIVVYDSSFAEIYWPYLTEIVRVTGKNIFWMILCHTEVERLDSSVQVQRQRFIELVGLENYDIVFDPENVFNPKDTKKTDGCGALSAKAIET